MADDMNQQKTPVCQDHDHDSTVEDDYKKKSMVMPAGDYKSKEEVPKNDANDIVPDEENGSNIENSDVEKSDESLQKNDMNDLVLGEAKVSDIPMPVIEVSEDSVSAEKNLQVVTARKGSAPEKITGVIKCKDSLGKKANDLDFSKVEGSDIQAPVIEKSENSFEKKMNDFLLTVANLQVLTALKGSATQKTADVGKSEASVEKKVNDLDSSKVEGSDINAPSIEKFEDSVEKNNVNELVLTEAKGSATQKTTDVGKSEASMEKKVNDLDVSEKKNSHIQMPVIEKSEDAIEKNSVNDFVLGEVEDFDIPTTVFEKLKDSSETINVKYSMVCKASASDRRVVEKLKDLGDKKLKDLDDKKLKDLGDKKLKDLGDKKLKDLDDKKLKDLEDKKLKDLGDKKKSSVRDSPSKSPRRISQDSVIVVAQPTQSEGENDSNHDILPIFYSSCNSVELVANNATKVDCPVSEESCKMDVVDGDCIQKSKEDLLYDKVATENKEVKEKNHENLLTNEHIHDKEEFKDKPNVDKDSKEIKEERHENLVTNEQIHDKEEFQDKTHEDGIIHKDMIQEDQTMRNTMQKDTISEDLENDQCRSITNHEDEMNGNQAFKNKVNEISACIGSMIGSMNLEDESDDVDDHDVAMDVDVVKEWETIDKYSSFVKHELMKMRDGAVSPVSYCSDSELVVDSVLDNESGTVEARSQSPVSDCSDQEFSLFRFQLIRDRELTSTSRPHNSFRLLSRTRSLSPMSYCSDDDERPDQTPALGCTYLQVKLRRIIPLPKDGNQGDYPCMYCKRRFWSPRLVNQHQTFHESNQLVECTLCNMSFTKQQIYSHLFNVHAVTMPISGAESALDAETPSNQRLPKRCPICQSYYQNLDAHMVKHETAGTQCPACHGFFIRMKTHFIQAHRHEKLSDYEQITGISYGKPSKENYKKVIISKKYRKNTNSVRDNREVNAMGSDSDDDYMRTSRRKSGGSLRGDDERRSSLRGERVHSTNQEHFFGHEVSEPVSAPSLETSMRNSGNVALDPFTSIPSASLVDFYLDDDGELEDYDDSEDKTYKPSHRVTRRGGSQSGISDKSGRSEQVEDTVRPVPVRQKSRSPIVTTENPQRSASPVVTAEKRQRSRSPAMQAPVKKRRRFVGPRCALAKRKNLAKRKATETFESNSEAGVSDDESLVECRLCLENVPNLLNHFQRYHPNQPVEEMEEGEISLPENKIVRKSSNLPGDVADFDSTWSTEESEPEGFPCPECPEIFADPQSLKLHSAIHSNRKSCPICRSTIVNLTAHFASCSVGKIHRLSDDNPKISPKIPPMVSSKRSSEKTLQCEICSRTFRHIYLLKEHRLTHEIEDLHTCEICDLRFTKPLNLYLHQLQVHDYNRSNDNVEKLKKTQKAGPKSFKEKNQSLSSKPSSTSTNKERKMGPKSVMERSRSMQGSKTQLNTNLVEKPHLNITVTKPDVPSSPVDSGVAGNSFADLSCRACSKTFTSRARLMNHLLSHTGEKRHDCGECGKSFAEKRYLVAHMQRVHYK